MKKKDVLLMALGLGMIISFVGFNTSAWALKKTKKVIIKKNTNRTVHVNKRPLPDLIVNRIELTSDCKIKITVTNRGNGGVPDTGYHMKTGAAVQMYKNRAPWGGIRLGAIDPAKKLKTPGASVSHVWFPKASNLKLGPGKHTISVEVDKNNAVNESNEKNNKKTVRLRCKNIIGKNTKKMAHVKKRFLPDLIVSKIELTSDCKIKITITNRGKAGVPDTGYHMKTGAAIQMYKNRAPWGGIRLGAIDPAKKLKTPGASVSHVWFPDASNLDIGPGKHHISVEVDKNNAVKESNEKNNIKRVRIKCKNTLNTDDLSVKISQCPGGVTAGQNLGSGFQVQAKSSFPNAVNNIAVDIILTSSPTYPVPAPYAGYSPNYSNHVLLKGGREFISFTGPGTVNVTLNGNNQIPFDTPPGNYYLAAVVDAGNNVTETNEQNNVAFCPIQIAGVAQSVPGIDLNVASIKISSQSPSMPPVHRVLLRIKNNGSSPIPLGTNSKIKVYVDGTLVDTIDLDDSRVEQTPSNDVHHAFDPANVFKSTSTVTTNHILPSAGTYTCEAVIDATNTITETDEGNNSRTRIVTISSP